MRTRVGSELNLKTSSQPIRSIEVDLNGLPDGAGPNPGIVAALLRCLKFETSPVATVYVRIGPSTNFGEYTWSAFVAPLGPMELLEEIRAAFSGLGARAKLSEAVLQSECVAQMHVEDRTIWVPDEPGTWCALEIELEEEEQDLSISPKPRAPRRQRAARDDASVGTIIRKIEDAFGLPRGSVALRDPDRKVLRRDALIVTLRRRWDE